VDVYAAGSTTPLLTNLAYGQASAYIRIAAGTYNIQVRGHGADPATPPVFETGNLQIAAGDEITALATGLLASSNVADSFRILPLIESFGTPAPRYARIRVVHASPDAPSVGIDLGDDGSVEIPTLGRFADTGPEGVDVPGGTAISTGILANGQRITGFTIPALEAGTRYFVIAAGLVAQSNLDATDAFKLLAVDGEGSAAFVTQDTPSPGTAMVRAVHASPDAPAVDVYLEGKIFPSVSNLRYGAATAYLSIPAGSRNIQLRAYPSVVTDPVVSQTGPLAFTPGQKVTAVAAGFLGSTHPSDALRILPLTENFQASPSTLVRIVHAVPDAPAVSLDVGDDGSSDVTSLGRFEDTGEAGVAFPSGQELQIGVGLAGGSRLTAFTTPALPGGEEIFLIAMGSTARAANAPDGFVLLGVTSTESLPFVRQNPVLYALHAGPDAPAVDIYDAANPSAPLVENLGFGQLSAPVQVPPDTYMLDFNESGQASTIGSFAVALSAGEIYFGIAAGELAPNEPEGAFTLLPFAHEAAVSIGAPLVRAIHASGDAPLVDIGTVDAGTGNMDTIVFPNLVFGQSSTPYVGTEVPAGNLTIGVAPKGEETPVATFDVAASAGKQIFAIAAGALVPGTGEEGFRMILVDATESPWAAAEVLPN